MNGNASSIVWLKMNGNWIQRKQFICSQSSGTVSYTHLSATKADRLPVMVMHNAVVIENPSRYCVTDAKSSVYLLSPQKFLHFFFCGKGNLGPMFADRQRGNRGGVTDRLGKPLLQMGAQARDKAVARGCGVLYPDGKDALGAWLDAVGIHAA